MKTIPNPKCRCGLTLIDTLVVIATLSLGILAILPLLARPGARSTRITCVNNLRQMGVAMRMWSNDNQERFPWTSTNLNETILQPYAYCLRATNELNSPKILVCPEDSARSRAVAFDQKFSNKNLSYFLGLDADETKPNTLMSGDRNLSTNNTILSGLVTIQDSKNLLWAPGIHKAGGNIGLGDGSSQQVSTKGIRSMIDDGKMPIPQRLLVP
jgi:hypothetical protein